MIRDDEWLVVVDRQRVFAENEWSAWGCADGSYHNADKPFEALAKAYGDRVVYTRYVAPERPDGAWKDYFADWPQFLVPADDPVYDLTGDTAALAQGHTVLSMTTFGKWGPELSRAIGGSTHIALCGVSTDCCVLATALAAGDAGVSVRVVEDACVGSTPENHRMALDVMRLFSPLVTVTDSAALLAD